MIFTDFACPSSDSQPDFYRSGCWANVALAKKRLSYQSPDAVLLHLPTLDGPLHPASYLLRPASTIDQGLLSPMDLIHLLEVLSAISQDQNFFLDANQDQETCLSLQPTVSLSDPRAGRSSVMLPCCRIPYPKRERNIPLCSVV